MRQLMGIGDEMLSSARKKPQGQFKIVARVRNVIATGVAVS